MTQEERNLLIQDLCGRLPYGVIAKKEYSFVFTNGTISKSKKIERLDLEDIDYLISGDNCVDVLKPYLRPMSSMTEEEQKEYHKTFRAEPYGSGIGYEYVESARSFDWLDKHHFDYRELINKGLALNAQEGMYKN